LKWSQSHISFFLSVPSITELEIWDGDKMEVNHLEIIVGDLNNSKIKRIKLIFLKLIAFLIFLLYKSIRELELHNQQFVPRFLSQLVNLTSLYLDNRDLSSVLVNIPFMLINGLLLYHPVSPSRFVVFLLIVNN
jgi:hypothetical protein